MSSKEKSEIKSVEQIKISVCDVMKSKTSSVIRKMESQIPSYAQEYSDLYAEYLHTIDDLFGTCYISEKEFFDKLNIDQKTLKAFDNLWSFWEKTATSQIEVSTNFMRTNNQLRISAIKSYDKYVHTMMDSYSKMLSEYNSAFKK
ncbi:MAG: hypothetical protein IIA83_10695 [Thaumarchaeota archaeon]|nr:hypothetical protein [Nitrososphaerota archaeon]